MLEKPRILKAVNTARAHMARAPNQLISFLNMGADLQPRLWQLRHNTENSLLISLIAGNLPRRETGADPRENQPGDACGYDRNDPVPGEFLHEQISKTRLH
jgi:hypothetical protein